MKQFDKCYDRVFRMSINVVNRLVLEGSMTHLNLEGIF